MNAKPPRCHDAGCIARPVYQTGNGLRLCQDHARTFSITYGQPISRI